MVKFKTKTEESVMKKKFDEAALVMETPKLIVPLVKYWDKFPLGTKEEFFAAYEKLEDMNHHDGCAYLIAKFSKNKKVTQMILYITAIHEIFGSMPYELDRLRYELTAPMYKKIAGMK